jgi:hypothetical protein
MQSSGAAICIVTLEQRGNEALHDDKEFPIRQ